jgi:chitinase
MKKFISLAIMVFYSSIALCAALPEQMDAEVAHLLQYLETSGCQFQRNGTWHPGGKAKQHLKQKFDYLLNKGLIETTEDFIRLGASQSSMSGKPYYVRCPEKEIVPSAQWLQTELLQYRKPQK